MITGVDTVIVTARPPVRWLSRFLDQWGQLWPEMMVDRAGTGFEPWHEGGREPFGENGDIVVVRDAQMAADWTENAYEDHAPDVGPIGLMYQPCEVGTFSMDLTSDPYARDQDFGFEPYNAQVIGSGVYLLTLITPENSGELTNRAVSVLQNVVANS